MIFGTLYFSPSPGRPCSPPAFGAALGAGPGGRLLPALPRAPGVCGLGPAAPGLRLSGPRRRPAPPLLALVGLVVPQLKRITGHTARLRAARTGIAEGPS